MVFILSAGEERKGGEEEERKGEEEGEEQRKGEEGEEEEPVVAMIIRVNWQPAVTVTSCGNGASPGCYGTVSSWRWTSEGLLRRPPPGAEV